MEATVKLSRGKKEGQELNLGENLFDRTSRFFVPTDLGSRSFILPFVSRAAGLTQWRDFYRRLEMSRQRGISASILKN